MEPTCAFQFLPIESYLLDDTSCSNNGCSLLYVRGLFHVALFFVVFRFLLANYAATICLVIFQALLDANENRQWLWHAACKNTRNEKQDASRDGKPRSCTRRARERSVDVVWIANGCDKDEKCQCMTDEGNQKEHTNQQSRAWESAKDQIDQEQRETCCANNNGKATSDLGRSEPAAELVQVVWNITASFCGLDGRGRWG